MIGRWGGELVACLFLLVLVAGTQSARAGDVLAGWGGQGFNFFDSAQLACESFFTPGGAVVPTLGVTQQYSTCGGEPQFETQCGQNNDGAGGGTGGFYRWVQQTCTTCGAGQIWDPVSDSCKDPVDCSGLAGQKQWRLGGSTGGCSGGCQLVRVAGGLTVGGSGVGQLGYNEYTGASCAPDSEPDGTLHSGPCLENGSGSEVCLTPTAQNCGTYNGQFYCVSPLDGPGCLTTPSGAVVCQLGPSGEQPADAPENGFGAPSVPDTEWTHEDTAGNPHSMEGHSGGPTTGGPAAGGADTGGTGDPGAGGSAGSPEGLTFGNCPPSDPSCIADPGAITEATDGDGDTGDGVGGPPSPFESATEETWSHGLPGTSSCPAPMSFTIHSEVIQIEYTWFCDLAGNLRPLVLGAGYLSAALIILGVRLKG